MNETNKKQEKGSFSLPNEGWTNDMQIETKQICGILKIGDLINPLNVKFTNP